MSAKISYIIPTHNRQEDLVEHIKSVKKSTYKNLEIIVVDNASSDNSVRIVKKLFPDVKVIESQKNLNAAGGRNLGMKNVSKESSYLILMDDDVVIEPDTISNLYKAINARPEYAAATGKVLFLEKPTVVQLAGSSVGLLTSFNYANTGPDDGRFDQPCDSFAGGAILIKREVADKVGFYDEVYPRLYEDADYSVRIIRTGKRILYVPSARIYHKAHILDKKSATDRWLSGAYFASRNKIIFMSKFSPCFPCFIFLIYPAFLLFYTYQSVRFSRIDALLNFYKGTLAGLKWALNYHFRK
ncbi:MAG: glycosyl transferase [Candidatus Magasanikbacteria bacterium GW2011_GWA2_42_32]|uniref:Glycosyl transferase n=1 Tax=Candidatus Magasanikbacteria bacterium GW2011_GWA2_42_32 TaxID=1619039 RepID=A0A0G1C774_9BACT|nr:MAG: glycosyl transferase [Candidatus Magasanikbacteria bacterium GW2011_GWA2_42_32]